MSSYAKGILITVMAVLVLSPDAVLVRLAGLDLWTLLFWRSLFASAGFFLLTLAIEGRGTFAAYAGMGRLALLLVCCYGATAFLFVASLVLTSAANALILLATAPVFSAIYSRLFLGESIRLRTVAAIVGCILGIAILVGGDLGSPSLWGDLCGLLNAMTWGASIGGAAVGALGGLAIGAIAGSAGKGAAIGAVAGAIGGRRARRRTQQQAAQQGAAQAQAQNQQALDTFKKAAGACLEGRGYTVK